MQAFLISLVYMGILHWYFFLQVLWFLPHSVCFHILGDHRVSTSTSELHRGRRNENNERFWNYSLIWGCIQSSSVSFSQHLSSIKGHEISLHSDAGLLLFIYYLNYSMNYSRPVLNNLSRDLETHLVLEILFH